MNEHDKPVGEEKSALSDDLGLLNNKTAWLFFLPAVLYAFSAASLMPSIILFVLLWFLAVIDWQDGRLPNIWTLLLTASGLAVNSVWGDWPMPYYIKGMVAGFSALFFLNYVYRIVRGRDGMGGGDMKFMAGCGAWLGWPHLPFVLLFASAGALLFVLLRNVTGHAFDSQSRLPFGPFLCLGTWCVWLFLA